MKCKLRELVENAIASDKNTTPEDKALAVMCVLEDEIGLSGNGWFDDDEAVALAIDKNYKERPANKNIDDILERIKKAASDS